MVYRALLIAFICTLFASCGQESGEIWMPKIFSDGMVMQRNVPIPIFGKANPRGKLMVIFGGITYSTQANAAGDWRVDIGPFKEGGAFEMEVIGSEKLLFSDIYIGEVWLCGGQSNMQYTLDMLKLDETSDKRSYYQPLRFFNVEVDWDVAVPDDIKGGEWQTVNSDNVGSLSAVAYYFGKLLQDSLDVPIGLISSNLGATSIETWMSVDALRTFPQFDKVLEEGLIDASTKKEMFQDLDAYRETWDTAFYLKGPGMDGQWYLPETSTADWDTMSIPALWQDRGLTSHHGAVWFRREIDTWPTFFGDQPYVSLNQIDDYDIVWLNGEKIGEGFGSRSWRRYDIPKELIKESGNVLVVRVFDTGGKGGMYTSPFWGNEVLNGTWLYKKGLSIDPSTFPVPVVPSASIFTHPSVLYNANIAPIAPYGIKGVIWYQGESNEQRGEEYAELLPALIADWRSTWASDTLPFYIAQLANYRAENPFPTTSNWAEIRDAQSKAASTDPNVGIATAIDIGDAFDIHPVNKKELSKRLAWGALRNTYGRSGVPISPELKTSEISGDTIVITIETYGQTLVSRNPSSVFQIAGEDQKFIPAKFYLEGDQIKVFSNKVKDPKAVRYAWADNPGPLNIYNEQGLPLLPFRTDEWDLSSKGKVFEYDPWGF